MVRGKIWKGEGCKKKKFQINQFLTKKSYIVIKNVLVLKGKWGRSRSFKTDSKLYIFLLFLFLLLFQVYEKLTKLAEHSNKLRLG
jgi:hypothetical protein